MHLSEPFHATNGVKPGEYWVQGRIKGGATGAISPGPPLQGGPRDEIYLLQINYPFEKFLWFRSDTTIQLYIILR